MVRILRRLFETMPWLLPWAPAAYWLLHPLKNVLSLRVLGEYFIYWRNLRAFRMLPGGKAAWRHLRPALGDRHRFTQVDETYFKQDTWAAGKILSAAPGLHVDAGSSAWLVGILAQAMPVISLDIRPLRVAVPGLSPLAGDLTHLPLSDGSLPSVSSLCVIEHIGLGRYGDRLDPAGSVKAAKELARVVAVGGDLYVSAPVGESAVHFDAHRSFAPAEVIQMFEELRLEELVLVQGGEVIDSTRAAAARPSDPVVVGLFHFKRPPKP